MDRYFHFLKADMRHGEGQEQPWREGEHREVEGQVILCYNGYHASKDLWDAVGYAPGPVVCLVELTGETVWDSDKLVAQGRRLVKAVNIEKELRLFASDWAERLTLFEKEFPRVTLRAAGAAGRIAWDTARVAAPAWVAWDKAVVTEHRAARIARLVTRVVETAGASGGRGPAWATAAGAANESRAEIQTAFREIVNNALSEQS